MRKKDIVFIVGDSWAVVSLLNIPPSPEIQETTLFNPWDWGNGSRTVEAFFKGIICLGLNLFLLS